MTLAKKHGPATKNPDFQQPSHVKLLPNLPSGLYDWSKEDSLPQPETADQQDYHEITSEKPRNQLAAAAYLATLARTFVDVAREFNDQREKPSSADQVYPNLQLVPPLDN